MFITLEKVIILGSVDIFKETQKETLAQVADIVEEVSLDKGSVIFEEGDHGDYMCIIARGSVRIHKGVEEICVLKDREFFGELAVLDPEPRMATATTASETVLFKIHQSALLELMSADGQVTRGILKELSKRLRSVSK